MISTKQSCDKLQETSATAAKSADDWKSNRDCDQEAIMQVAIIAGLLFNTSYCDIQNSLRFVNPNPKGGVQWDTYFIFITVGIYLLCTFFALCRDLTNEKPLT